MSDCEESAVMSEITSCSSQFYTRLWGKLLKNRALVILATRTPVPDQKISADI
jgi:hypothetical protein